MLYSLRNCYQSKDDDSISKSELEDVLLKCLDNTNDQDLMVTYVDTIMQHLTDVNVKTVSESVAIRKSLEEIECDGMKIAKAIKNYSDNLIDSYNILVQYSDSAEYKNPTVYLVENSVESMEVFKDFVSPTINNVTVSKTESGLDRVLRILLFGIYSNDKIRYTVEASDMQNDSGLASNAVWLATKKDAVYPDDFIEMKYDGEKDGQHNYYFVIPADGTIYPELTETAMAGEIAIHVTDRFGHKSDNFAKINSSDGTIGDAETNSKNFMIEQIKPVIITDKPDSDGETRTDNTT